MGCSKEIIDTEFNYTSWDEVLADGRNQEVTILMWGGNESINQYIDTYVASHVKEMYGITLRRVPMNAPEYLSKLLNEKKNNVDEGTADLVWINAENFRTAKEGGLLIGPYTDLLPNLNSYYDTSASDLNYDSGTAIEGYEGIWGRAQLVLTYDQSEIDPPKTYHELLAWVKEHPGRFTYPRIPDDFVGVAFVRNAFYEITGQTTRFQEDMTEEEFRSLAEPVMAYFKELNTYLWQEGQVYPATQAQMDELYKNGEIDLTMGFEIGKTPGQVASGVYSKSSKSYVFDTGTIGNSHYLALPFNAPELAGALLVMDFLQSPEAQVEKMKADVWGDMPAIDVTTISQNLMDVLASIENEPGALSIDYLTSHRNPEMKAQYIDWIKDIWKENFGE